MTSPESDEQVERFVEILEDDGRPRTSTWTEQFVAENVARPGETKDAASLCATCPAPCERDELCATVLVNEADLLDDVGRDQAFWFIEAGMERLEIKGEARVRADDDTRPNTFVSETDRQ